jgi:predicted transcriptional regulator
VLGLTAEEIEVLREISTDRDMGALDMANRVGASREMLRLPLKHLEERRLIRSTRAGRSRLYRRVYDFPEFKWQESELALEPFSSAGEVVPITISETKLTQAIKGLIPNSEVQQYKEFVYPLYRVELVRGRKKRIVWLDGRSGRELRA